MKPTLIKIANILWQVPLMSKAILISIINPIETEEQANRMLNFLEKNIDNPNIMDTDYLIPNKRKIIGL